MGHFKFPKLKMIELLESWSKSWSIYSDNFWEFQILLNFCENRLHISSVPIVLSLLIFCSKKFRKLIFSKLSSSLKNGFHRGFVFILANKTWQAMTSVNIQTFCRCTFNLNSSTANDCKSLKNSWSRRMYVYTRTDAMCGNKDHLFGQGLVDQKGVVKHSFTKL